MAIFIPGMHCALSGRRIASVDEAVMFAPFVSNEADPLYVFNDAVVHIDVFRNHPLADEARARYSDYLLHTKPSARICHICGLPIMDPDDYAGVPFLVDDDNHPLHRWNYTHFHRACLGGWSGTPALIRSLEDFDKSGAWKGEGLKWVINDLRKASQPTSH